MDGTPETTIPSRALKTNSIMKLELKDVTMPRMEVKTIERTIIRFVPIRSERVAAANMEKASKPVVKDNVKLAAGAETANSFEKSGNVG